MIAKEIMPSAALPAEAGIARNDAGLEDWMNPTAPPRLNVGNDNLLWVDQIAAFADGLPYGEFVFDTGYSRFKGKIQWNHSYGQLPVLYVCLQGWDRWRSMVVKPYYRPMLHVGHVASRFDLKRGDAAAFTSLLEGIAKHKLASKSGGATPKRSEAERINPTTDPTNQDKKGSPDA